MRLMLAALLVSVLVPMAGGCTFPHSPGPELVFIIPKGYRGIVILSAEDPGGVDATPVNNLITLRVGGDGKVSVRGELPTLEWHRPSAVYEDGTPLPMPKMSEKLADDVVAFRPMGLKGDKEDWYLVGTYEDLDKAFEKKDGFKFEGVKKKPSPNQ
jgi:hypothetical protein